jgi:hypothetical protein
MIIRWGTLTCDEAENVSEVPVLNMASLGFWGEKLAV